MSDEPAIKRQLKIKTGVVNRLFKEHKSYLKETGDLEKNLQRLEAQDPEAGDNAWEIKNGKNMLKETKKVVAETAGRLETGAGQLRDLVNSVERDDRFSGSEELEAAKKALEVLDE
ncbi:tubulin binding cofactor A [Phellopilus nigrolimitatus]|nr:tubulin binding cofactor A [Phellopilus nigrolimitatus]